MKKKTFKKLGITLLSTGMLAGVFVPTVAEANESNQASEQQTEQPQNGNSQNSDLDNTQDYDNQYKPEQRGPKVWLIRKALETAVKKVGKASTPMWVEKTSLKLAGASEDLEKGIYNSLRSIGVPKGLAKDGAKAGAFVLL